MKRIEDIFRYHAPTDEQKVRYQKIRTAALELAFVIKDNVIDGVDQARAIDALREAVMFANAAIALENDPEDDGKEPSDDL